MRLLEIDKPNELTQTIKTITRECSESLKIMRAVKCPLYRGIDEYDFQLKPASAIRLTSPVKRKPTGMSFGMQKFTDYCLKKVGSTALRSNSICCTGHMDSADSFGVIYCIFPVNGFSFAWSPKIWDFGGEGQLDSKWKMLDEIHMTAKIDPYEAIENEKMVKWYLNYAKFDTTNFAKAIKSRNEIMIHGDYYMTHDIVGKQIIGIK